MQFKEWLLVESDIRFAGWIKDGRIIVNIQGKRYVYLTDAMYHDKWKRMAPYSPWKVLNQIKKQVELGNAELIEK